jgi:DNA-binding helix-hairpin-helix protein with protein kinase domain
MRQPALDLAQGDAELAAAVERARKLLHKRSLAGAATSAIPIPGVGWAADAALLSRLITGINAVFGLTPEQLAALTQPQRKEVEGAAEAIGSTVIGKLVTNEVVRKVALAVGKRMAVKQAAKYIPLGGQAVSALIGYNAMRAVGEAHIRDCVRVCLQAGLKPPALPEDPPRPKARPGRKSAPH